MILQVLQASWIYRCKGFKKNLLSQKKQNKAMRNLTAGVGKPDGTNRDCLTGQVAFTHSTHARRSARDPWEARK